MARNKKPKRIDYIEWTKQWQSGEKWFARLKAKKGSPDQTLKHYGISLHKFAEYKGSDPDTILAQYKAGAKEDLDEALDAIEVDLDLFINWLCDPGGLKRSSAVQRTNAIRSWLSNNAKSLKGIPTPQAYSESALPLTMDELQEIVIRAYKNFYLRPGYIWRRLIGLRSLSEFKRKAKAGLGVLRMGNK